MAVRGSRKRSKVVPFDRRPEQAARNRCGLCGKTGRLTKTECCDHWICDDEASYVPFSFARNSCYRNHARQTLCAYHFNEEHPGRWQDCPTCRDAFPTEMFVWYGTNEYNFELLERIPAFQATHCAGCGKRLVLPNGGYSFAAGEYWCEACSTSPKRQTKTSSRRRRPTRRSS